VAEAKAAVVVMVTTLVDRAGKEIVIVAASRGIRHVTVVANSPRRGLNPVVR
jgi:hypothetical protein